VDFLSAGLFVRTAGSKDCIFNVRLILLKCGTGLRKIPVRSVRFRDSPILLRNFVVFQQFRGRLDSTGQLKCGSHAAVGQHAALKAD